MLARSYSVAVSDRMRVAVDHSWHRTDFNGSNSFRSLTAGFRWQP